MTENSVTDIDQLKAVYEEKQAKYHALCNAVEAAFEAHQTNKAMCDEAMADVHEAGEKLLAAMADAKQ